MDLNQIWPVGKIMCSFKRNKIYIICNFGHVLKQLLILVFPILGRHLFWVWLVAAYNTVVILFIFSFVNLHGFINDFVESVLWEHILEQRWPVEA